METKANYFLIGLFTVAGLLLSMAFLLWLAKIEVDRQYAYYFIKFDNVSGLGNAGDVRFNGLPVGSVVDLRLDPDSHSQVLVRIELDAETPVRTDTVATLQSQGVTGVSFVALSGGSAEAALLPQDSVIPSERSPLQSVLEGAPILLQRAVDLLEDVGDVVNETNRSQVTQILSNLSSASGRLDKALQSFETLSADLSSSATAINSFTTRLDSLADTADAALVAATQTLSRGDKMIEQGTATLETADATLTSMNDAFASANALIEGDLAALVTQSTETARRIEGTLDTIEAPAKAAFDNAATALSEATQTFASANRVFEEDIETVFADIGDAVSTFKTAMTNASQNFDVVSQEVLRASQSASSFAEVLESVAVANREQMSRFLRYGLSEFLQLTEDAAQLVRNLDRFVDRIDRDPARYFFGTQGSEFSR